MALVKCKECGEQASTKAKSCPKCGAVRKKKILNLKWLILIILVVGVYNIATQDRTTNTVPQKATSVEKKYPIEDLIPHKFSPPYRPDRGRAQIRAIIKPQTYTQTELMMMAVDLSQKYKAESRGHLLVNFFSDESTLIGWDGTGGLRDSDWPSWMCRIAVDTDTNGNLYARTFKLAQDINSGLERTDVLKK